MRLSARQPKQHKFKQFVIDFTGVCGLFGWSWSMTDSPHPNYMFTSVIFSIAVLILAILLNDFLSERLSRKTRGVILSVVVTFFMGKGATTIWHDIVHPVFPYADVFIPAPEVTGDYHLVLEISGESNSIQGVGISVADVTDAVSGGDATEIIKNITNRYIPTIYAFPKGTDTGIVIPRRDKSEYHIDIGTNDGNFSEELSCGTNRDNETISVFRITSNGEFIPLVVGWKVNQDLSKQENTTQKRFLLNALRNKFKVG
jgi:hypothetical protein